MSSVEKAPPQVSLLLAIEEANPAVSNSATSTDAGAGVVTFEVTATGSSDYEAVATAASAIRAAIHAIDGSTPDFPTPSDVMEGITFLGGHLEAEPA